MSKEIRRPKPDKKRLRRTMMFMNAQKPGLIKDAYIYGTDSIILDLEDAVAENQKDAARFSLYHALKSIDYGDTEVIVRINGLDTPHWQEDVRVCVAGGADGIRIAKCESAEMVKTVDAAVTAAEKEFGVEEGRTLLMAALESPLGIMNAYEIVTASPRMFGCAISGGDFRKSMHRLARADFPNRKQIVHEILHPEDRPAPQSSYSHYSGINYSALEAAVRRIQQDFDFLMRYLPKLPDDSYAKTETLKILKQHKAYMAQFEEMLNDKEIA